MGHVKVAVHLLSLSIVSSSEKDRLPVQSPLHPVKFGGKYEHSLICEKSTPQASPNRQVLKSFTILP